MLKFEKNKNVKIEYDLKEQESTNNILNLFMIDKEAIFKGKEEKDILKNY